MTFDISYEVYISILEQRDRHFRLQCIKALDVVLCAKVRLVINFCSWFQIMPLINYPKTCVCAKFGKRIKRFTLEVMYNGDIIFAHTNNTGSMLGLTRQGATVLLSPANNPKRKLKYTCEAIKVHESLDLNTGTWVSVNTLAPNRLLEAAFKAQKLPFASHYTAIQREVPYKLSRLDAVLTSKDEQDLVVECKNVTLVEDDCAMFPDAQSERAAKHLQTLIEIVEQGGQAAMFYFIARNDASCFAPCGLIDAKYASLFYYALEHGVKMYAYTGIITHQGIDLGRALPLKNRQASLA